MKKITSILLALAMLVSLLPAYALTPVRAAEPEKYVSADIILPGDSAPTTLTAFTFEDFEDYSTTDPEQTAIGSLVGYTLTSKPTLTAYAGLNNSTALRVPASNDGNFAHTDTSNSFTAAARLWQAGNKVTELSFDVAGLSMMNRLNLYYGYAKELVGSTTATFFSPRLTSYGEDIKFSTSAQNTDSTTASLTGYFNNVDVLGNTALDSKITSVHIEMSMSYEYLAERKIKMVTVIKFYPFDASGSYTTPANTQTTTCTYDWSATDITATAEDLTILPVFNAETSDVYFDNIAMKSVDSEAIRFINTHGETLKDTTYADTVAWDEAADAWNGLSGLAQAKLANYAGAITAYAAEKVYNDLAAAGKIAMGNVMLPGATAATPLKVFLAENFEGYEDTDPEKTTIHSITGYTTATVPSLTTYANLNGSTVLSMPTATGDFDITDYSNAFSAAAQYWPAGNKVTKLSFDVAGLGMMNRLNLYYGYAKELAGSTTATLLSPQLTSYGSDIKFSSTAKKSDNTAATITNNFSNLDVLGNESLDTKITSVHIEMDMSYEYLAERSIKLTTVIKFYPFNASGSYTTPSNTQTTVVTYDWSATDITTKAAELTIFPNFHTQTGTVYYDNISMESVDSQVISFVNTHAAVFAENSTADAGAWEAATVAYKALPQIVQDRLVVYGEKIDDYYANADKVVTSDFTDAFTDGMFWTNYCNLNITDGNVTGGTNLVISMADGALVKDKALSVVKLTGLKPHG